MGKRLIQDYRPMPADFSQLKTDDRKCRECGCTDYDCSQCIERTGHPCHWVAADLCSACDDLARQHIRETMNSLDPEA